ncbi:hypothetical protein [Bacteroides sedimenti]
MKKYFILYCLLFLSSCFIISGSYPYAEYYRFDIPSDSLIVRIKELKKNNPQYNVITTFENGEIGVLPDDYSENFYSCYFYIKSIKTTMFCVINVSKEVKDTQAKIGFVGITTSENFASWKTINTKELSKEDNLKLKKFFEALILDKLGVWEKDCFFK